jgi:hypothetical protein
MTLYIAAIIGAIIYSGIDYISELGNDVFTKRYVLATLMNVIAGCALIWALQLEVGQFDIAGFDAMRLIAMAFGIFGQKLFKAIIALANKNIKTKLGINKKK